MQNPIARGGLVRALTLVLGPLITLALPATLEARNTVMLMTGTLAGQPITPSTYQITVSGGAVIQGSFSVGVFNDMPGSAIAPLAATPTWGAPSTSYWTVNSWVNTGYSPHVVNVYLMAPATPGTYYIAVAMAGTYNSAQIMSGTHPAWAADWVNGTKVALLPASDFETAAQQGWIPFNWWQPGIGYVAGELAMTAIRVVVQDGNPPPGGDQVAHYPFDGDAKDASGNGRDARLVNQASLVDAGCEGALSLDGVDDYVILPSDVVGGKPAGTFSAWLNIRSFPRGGAQIASQGLRDYTHFYLAAGSDGRITAHMSGGVGGVRYLTGNPILTSNTWTMVSFTWDGAFWNLYVNGVLYTNTPAINYPVVNADVFKLGRHEHISGPYMFDGLMDDVRIYNRALTQSNLLALYQEFCTAATNIPPILECPQTLAGECGQPVRVTTTVSDPDGDALVVVWSANGMLVQTNDVPTNAAPTELSLEVELPLGTNLVSVFVSDGTNPPVECSTEVIVQDTQPPLILRASATPNVLWPPNNKLVCVQVNALVRDACGDATWTVQRVTCSEKHDPSDIKIVDDHKVLLRATRSGKSGEGRVYTLWLQATDAAGSESKLMPVRVIVTHDQGNRSHTVSRNRDDDGPESKRNASAPPSRSGPKPTR